MANRFNDSALDTALDVARDLLDQGWSLYDRSAKAEIDKAVQTAYLANFGVAPEPDDLARLDPFLKGAYNYLRKTAPITHLIWR